MFKFQFQTGSIKRGFMFHRMLEDEGFNSKLVRLKEDAASKLADSGGVSIPNWFD